MKNRKKTNKKNPLFVVTNKGKTVEQADNFFDAFVKRFGLGPVINFFNTIVEMLCENVQDYAGLMVLKEFIDEFVEQLKEMKEKLDEYSGLAMAKLEGLLSRVYN